MSAAEVLEMAKAAGVSVFVDGRGLVLEAAIPPPLAVIEALKNKKADIIALLTPETGHSRTDAPPAGAPHTTAASRAIFKGAKQLGGGLNPVGGISAETAAVTAAILLAYGAQVRLLTTIPEATTAVEALLVAVGSDGVIGADIETTPLGAFAVPRRSPIIGASSSKRAIPNKDAGLDPYRAEVRVLSLWNPRGGNALVIDLRHVPIAALPKELWDARFVFHNATFDTKHLLHAGAPLRADRLFCSMLYSGFVARGQPFNSLEGTRRPGLAVAAKELLNVDVPKDGQTADWGLTHLDPALVDYAALDAVLSYQLLKVSMQKMGTGEKRAAKIACACNHAVARLELAGLPFDAEAHKAVVPQWELQLAAARTKAKNLTGVDNLNSSPQIAAWLDQTLPTKVRASWPRTPGGSLSTKGKVLRRYSEHHPGLQAVADYSKISTLVVSFGVSLIDKINPVTNRLHTNLQIAQAKSGRFSSRNPCLQNLPRGELVRGAVRVPAGSKLIVADYSQIELRVMAEVASDTRMRAAYASGLDLHAVTAAGMLGIAPGEFNADSPQHKAARQKAKGVNFGIVFGCGAPGLVEFARDNYGVVLTEPEAREVIATWLRTYPDVANWQKRHAAGCKASGTVQTPAGRIYRFAWEENGRFNHNLALNLPIQGGAAEVAQIAIAKTDALLSTQLGERARLVGQVHDEFLVVADEPVAERAKALLVAAMTEAFAELFPNAPVRDLVGVNIAASWAGAKE